MDKTAHSMSQKKALSPGSLVPVAQGPAQPCRVSLINYSQDHFEHTQDLALEDIPKAGQLPGVTWLRVRGLQQVEVIERIGQAFSLHALVLEDLINTHQRPKLEDFGEYLLVVVKMLYFDPHQASLRSQQVGLVLGESFVLSFTEEGDSPLEPMLGRIEKGTGRLRRKGADYLAYALLDLVVDHYFLVLEGIGDQVDDLEDKILDQAMKEYLEALYYLRQDLLDMRRAIWPLREITGSLMRGEAELIKQATLPFLRDLYDHTVQVLDGSEMLRESLGSLKDVYLSSVSNHMNQVMKVLTVIATLFIPLTFLAGIYGMNFKYMPELDLWWAYPALLLIMLVVVVVMLLYFRRKRWF